jgi:hypothetical protein
MTEFKGADMIRLFLFLLLVSMPTGCLAQKMLHDVCASKGNDEKYVLKLYKHPGRSAFACTMSSYLDVGDSGCESNLGMISSSISGFWTAISDLNRDDYPDVILSQWSGGHWVGFRPYHVLVNCGNNTYIKVLDNALATLKVGAFSQTTGWARLDASIEELKADGNYNELDIVYEFDKNIFSYEVMSLGNFKEKNDDWNDRDEFTINPKDTPRIIWENFPEMKGEIHSDDGLKSRCHKNSGQLFGFSPSDNTGEKYLNLCYVGLGGRCIASAEDKTNYQSKPRNWESVSGNSTGLYGWNSRFFHNSNSHDFIAFSENINAKMHKFSVYVDCSQHHVSGYLKVLDGTFTDIKSDTPDKQHLWADIYVTRQCLDEASSKFQSRTFILKFDESKFVYGPPNADPDLINPCSAKEMFLPFEEDKKDAE